MGGLASSEPGSGVLGAGVALGTLPPGTVGSAGAPFPGKGEPPVGLSGTGVIGLAGVGETGVESGAGVGEGELAATAPKRLRPIPNAAAMAAAAARTAMVPIAQVTVRCWRTLCSTVAACAWISA